MPSTPPTSVDEFKTRFDRDWPYGQGMDSVRDTDITRAMNDACMLFNSSVWTNTTELKAAFLLVAAHCLWVNLQMSGGLAAKGGQKGLRAQPGGPIQSKSVGSASVNYSLPPKLVNDPVLSGLMRSSYGAQYCQVFVPRKAGQMFTVPGFQEPDVAS